jgi:hypothetical protein
MKASVVPAAGMLVVSLLVAAPLPTRGQSAGKPAKLVRVDTVRGLLEAIGPRKTVILAAGVYDLSDAREVTTDSVSWRETETGEDYELVLTGVDGLTLRGEGKVSIVTPPPDSWVMAIEGSSQVWIENLGIGHSETGLCMAGVLLVENCDRITLQQVDLWGCGAMGLLVRGSQQIQVANSTIRDCTIGAVRIKECLNVTFDAVRIGGNQGYPVLSVVSSRAVSFLECTINGNSGFAVIEVDEASDRVDMSGTYLTGNTTERFAEESIYRVYLRNVRFSSNTFDEQVAGQSEHVEEEVYPAPDEGNYGEEYYEGE